MPGELILLTDLELSVLDALGQLLRLMLFLALHRLGGEENRVNEIALDLERKAVEEAYPLTYIELTHDFFDYYAACAADYKYNYFPFLAQ